ncbi:protein of unknown function [Rhodovastum atsumiense]|nr:protein of unknown function [Rhodovastum atsumiense]
MPLIALVIACWPNTGENPAIQARIADYIFGKDASSGNSAGISEPKRGEPSIQILHRTGC